MSQFGAVMQQPWMNGSSAQDSNRMMQHPMIHVVGDVKPRLTKEQHDILEAHFRLQHKPSTQTKKGFAENLGVPLDKINNWFQNRRAKVKQDAKKLANAQNMYLQQQMAQQMQNGNPAPQHSDFLVGPPHLGPSAFPMDNTNPNFMMHNQQGMMAAPGSVAEAHMMSVSSYPTTDLDIGNIDAKPNYMAYHQPQEFAYNHMTMTNVQDFGAMYGDITNMEGVDFAFMPGAPMQVTQSNGSTPSIPSTLSSMPSHSTMPSSTGGMNMPTLSSTDWSEDNKPTICFSEASDNIASAQAAYCSPPEDNSTARWVSQQPSFGETASPPAHIERPRSSQNLPPTPPDSKPLGELELPAEAFSRRPSSTHELSESLGNVDIQTRSSSMDASFKQPGEPSSIAARRQRPRPAALGQAALRSASYSAGMPTSPGSNLHNLSAPEQQLRRIRSSGVPGVSSGRIQKQNGPGQRSPLHMSFADAADSPKFTRHASAYAAIPSPGMQTLAPPTPLTPADGNRFPSWQSYGSVNSHHNSIDHSSPNGIAVSWTAESPALFQPHNVSSPPDTPLDTMQAAQYNNWAHASLHRDTPPQSAPAFQQSFNPAIFGGAMAHEPSSLAVNAAHMGHIRRPSLPEQGRMMPPRAPMYDTSTNDMPLTYQAMPYDHMQHMPPQPQATLPSQTTAAFPTPPQPAPASIPTSNNVLPADFAVHEYLPPGAPVSAKASASPTMIEHGSGPKMFHFSNTGPKDFVGQQ